MKENMQDKATASGVSRRKFLTYAGALTGAALLADACKKDDDDNGAKPKDGAINLGSGDIGLLNYFYLLEQLQANFYVKVMASAYGDMTKEERNLLESMRDHEIAHREFLKNYLAGDAIATQEFDFSNVDFTSRESVWATARELEETILSGYTGAASLVITSDNFMYIAKMMAVEARHAAMVRNRIESGSFSNTTNANGIDTGMLPNQVLAKVKPYLKSDFSANNLPQN